MKRDSDRIKEYEDKRYRQYGIVGVGKEQVLMDSEELSSYLEYRAGKSVEVTHFPKDQSPYYLAYGVLLNFLKGKEKPKMEPFEAEKNINYPHATVYGGEAYISWYPEIVLDQALFGDDRYLPAALLLKTSLPVEKKRFNGFGYTLFPAREGYQNIFDEIINREYVLCIRDIEKKYDGYEKGWIYDVDIEKMNQVADILISKEGGDGNEKRGRYA